MKFVFVIVFRVGNSYHGYFLPVMFHVPLQMGALRLRMDLYFTITIAYVVPSQTYCNIAVVYNCKNLKKKKLILGNYYLSLIQFHKCYCDYYF